MKKSNNIFKKLYNQFMNENPEKEEKVIEETVENQSNTNTESAQKDLQKEIDDWKDKFLRLASEFDNYKKRTQKEKSELIKYGNEDLLKSFLGIIDDFDRTMKVVKSSDNLEQIVVGIELIHKNLYHILTKKGVEVMDTIGQTFNSDFHEAIGSFPVEDADKKGKIIEELEKGFIFEGKVLRYAKVITGA